MTIRVKNWERFQHYKNRRPPWIKLYRDLLDDPHWHALSGDASKLLSMCWLIASDMPQLDGTLPDLETLAFRCRITNKKTAELLSELKHFIIFDAIDVLARCLQDAIPETEREIRDKDRVSSPTDSHPSGEGAPPLRDGAPRIEMELTPSSEPKPRVSNKKGEAKGDPVWREYIPAYRKRYGKEPIRNRSQNIAACQIVDRIGKRDAGAVAAFYVRSNTSWYIQKGHTLKAMVADSEKLHTEWATNRRATQTGARQADQRQALGDAASELLAQYELEEALDKG